MGNRLKVLGIAFAAMLAVGAAVLLMQRKIDGISPAAEDSGRMAGGPLVMRRLTEAQYRNIITDVFGDTIKLGGRFEPDPRVRHLIAVGTGQASVTASGLEQYDKMARSVADQVVDADHRPELIECQPASPTAPDDACTQKFLGRVGRLLLGRPLDPDDLQGYVAGAAAATRKTGDYHKGLALALAGILESPQFLYRRERSEHDPVHPDQLRLDAYSKAQRLSFLLWNTTPDSDLLAAAETGELQTPDGLARQVDRLLASPRLEAGVRAFFSDMLEFDTFDTLAKDTQLYPKFTFEVVTQAPEQTLRTLVDLLITQNGDYRDVFTTRRTFLIPILGSIYRVPVVAPDNLPDAWTLHEFPADSGQSGILTQVSFVGLHSHPGRSSPTLRGRALREILLCMQVPDPPGNVDFTLVQNTFNPQYKTARARLTAHATEATCAGCHKIIDPIGLSLENFDTVGDFRDMENGAKIDASGELDGVRFTDAAGLGKALHDNPQSVACLVQRAFDYALGRSATKSEKAWRTGYLEKQFAADGYRLPALLRRIAMSDTYYRVIPEPVGQAAAESHVPKENPK